MKVRRMTPLLVAVPVLSGLVAAPVGASETARTSSAAGSSFRPMDRAPQEDGDSSDPKKKKPEQEACPQDMWTVPVEIEGLACVLLIPKDDPAADDKDKEKP